MGTPEPATESQVCPKCGEIFSSEDELKDHAEQEHGNDAGEQ